MKLNKTQREFVMKLLAGVLANNDSRCLDNEAEVNHVLTEMKLSLEADKVVSIPMDEEG